MRLGSPSSSPAAASGPAEYRVSGVGFRVENDSMPWKTIENYGVL